MQTAAALVVAAIVIALSLLAGRYVWPASRGVDPALLEKARVDLSLLQQECSTIRTELARREVDCETAVHEATKNREDVVKLTERAEMMIGKTNEQADAIAKLQSQLDQARSSGQGAEKEVARLTEREASLLKKVADQERQLAGQQSRLTTEFENIANKVLADNARRLSETSDRSLAGIVDPLREKITEFQNKVETTYSQEQREVLSLKTQIELLLQTSTTIGSQADGLAKALRGDSKQIGRWGELTLERILEAAGLQEGREYITQGRGLGLTAEDGRGQRPDVIVNLPQGRTVIVDSKVSLASYDRLIATQEDGFRAQLVADMREHVDELAERRYQDNEKLQAHDYALMFVPIEGALAAALNKDPELFLYGWNQRVVLVGPSTLLMTMRTVHRMWQYERQSENAQEIARLAGEMCDKVSASLGDLNSVAEKIKAALDAHYGAVKRLSTGRQNVLTIGERIRGLGVGTKTEPPTMLIEGVSTAAISDDGQEGAPTDEGDATTAPPLPR
jgi:DNA recombination protein RmuC